MPLGQMQPKKRAFMKEFGGCALRWPENTSPHSRAFSTEIEVVANEKCPRSPQFSPHPPNGCAFRPFACRGPCKETGIAQASADAGCSGRHRPGCACGLFASADLVDGDRG